MNSRVFVKSRITCVSGSENGPEPQQTPFNDAFGKRGPFIAKPVHVADENYTILNSNPKKGDKPH